MVFNGYQDFEHAMQEMFGGLYDEYDFRAVYDCLFDVVGRDGDYRVGCDDGRFWECVDDFRVSADC